MVGTLTKGHLPWVAPGLVALAMTLNPSLVGAEGVRPSSPSDSTRHSITVDDTGKSSKAVPLSSVLTTSPTNSTPNRDLATSLVKLDPKPLAASQVKPNGIPASSSTNPNPVRSTGVLKSEPTVLVVTQSPQPNDNVSKLDSQPPSGGYDAVTAVQKHIQRVNEGQTKMEEKWKKLPPPPGG